jgi:flagellar protein FliO/FliZ
MDSTIGAALSGLLGTIIALAVVLGLAWVSLRALRRWQDRGLAGPNGVVERQIRFVRALPVGQRERLVLVEAEGELMLVGVTPGSISLLRNWGAAKDPEGVPPPTSETIQ